MRRLLVTAVLALVFAAPGWANGPSLFFLDARHGWASGDGGVLATSDGGRTWTVVERRRGTLFALQFRDRLHGFALSGDTVVETRDGGRSWRAWRRHVVGIAYPWLVTSFQRFVRIDGRPTTTPARISSLCAAGGRTVWAASGAALFLSRDAGRSWRKAFTERAGTGGSPWAGRVACRGSEVWALFTDGAATSHQAYVVAHSQDNGSTWTHPLAQAWFHLGQRAAIDAYAGPFAFSGRSAFFAGSCDPCGGRGRLTLTATDDARHFRRTTIAPAAGRWISAISFPDRRTGFVAIASARRAVLYKTADGGRTWRPVVASRLLRPTFS